jgi:hypothetical protein
MPTVLKCPACQAEGYLKHTFASRHKLQCMQCSRVFSEQEIIRIVLDAPTSKRRTTRGRSDRQEKRTAKKYSGQRTLNSGAMDDKGDVKVAGKYRFEDKTTRGRSYVLKLDDLRKLARQARGDEMPVLKVCFEDNLDQQYCVIPQDWFDQLLRDDE